MTEKQFNELRIGDKVMNGSLTGEVVVLDIDRNKATINTGGTWRSAKNVRLAGILTPDIKELVMLKGRLKRQLNKLEKNGNKPSHREVKEDEEQTLGL